MTEPGHQHERPGDRTALRGEAVALREDESLLVLPRRGLPRLRRAERGVCTGCEPFGVSRYLVSH